MHRLKPHEDLSPEKLQLFAAGLQGMPPDEVRKAKILFIRNAISEQRASREMARHMTGGCLGFLHGKMMRRMMETNFRLQEDRILNAMRVWQDDLADEEFHFPP